MGAGWMVRLAAGVLMVVLPGLVGFFVVRFSEGLKARYFLWGAGSFVFSQVLHLPFNRWVLVPGLEAVVGPGWSAWGRVAFSGAVLGLSAGVFEECSRWLAFRQWAPRERRWTTALALGVGHGGLESILVGILVLYALAQAAALKNPAVLGALEGEQARLAAEQLEGYWSTPWTTVMLGAVERFSALLFHMGASVLVMQVFRRGSKGWLAGAVLAHTVLNAAAVYGVSRWGLLPAEAVIFVLGATAAGLGWSLRPRGGQSLPEPGPAEGPPSSANPGADLKNEVSDEQLENSR